MKYFSRAIFWLVVLSFVALVDICFPMDWTATNQATLAWNQVTTLGDGLAVPEGDTISYEVFIVPELGAKDIDMKSVGITDKSQYVISFPDEGKFFLGVRALRYSAGQLVAYSIKAWSDDPVVVKDGVIFGVIFFKAPGSVAGLEVLNYVN